MSASLTASIRLRFRNVAGGKVAMDHQWASDSLWYAFGDPVPLDEGPHTAFGVHDLYHFSLMAEAGWSEVLEQLLAGKNDGVFGGLDALREEAVVLDRYLMYPNTIAKSTALLGYRVSKQHLKAALERGDKVKDLVCSKLRKGESPICTIRLPIQFWTRCAVHRVAQDIDPLPSNLQ